MPPSSPDHTPPEGAAPHIDDCEPTSARNARVGLALFVIYLALYGGFMGLSAFAHEQMARPVLAGVNLAIVYGFALIVAALALSLVYMVLVRAPARGSEMHSSARHKTADREDRR